MSKLAAAVREQQFTAPAHTCTEYPGLACPACALHSLATGEKCEAMVKERKRLKGVQLHLLEKFPRLAYRCRMPDGGTLVLCDDHLEAVREAGPAPLTGESFPATQCDHCLEKQGKVDKF